MISERLPGLEGVLLEESYVLDVTATPGRLEVSMDLVVLPGHALYHDPVPGERLCFVRATLVFAGVSELCWLAQGQRLPAIDAAGETDFGGVDRMELTGEGWRFQGDWGDVRLKAESIDLMPAERP